jgi:hypothetical protein
MTSLNFDRKRVAVVRGAALDDVGNENIATAKARHGQQLVEQLARWAHEGPSLLVLMPARRLPDKEDFGRQGSLTGHGMTANSAKLAALTSAYFLS